jgi:hypothetical protein
VLTVYAIASLDARQADPALLACWVRALEHRGPPALDARRDLLRDHSQVCTAHGPTNLAALRTVAINAVSLTGHAHIVAGLREHA